MHVPARLGVLVLVASVGCSGPEPVPAGSERERILGPFLAGHWRIPTAPQGPAPDTFGDAEASLDPSICGACHPVQHAQWRSSLHASAYTPGLAAQLIEGPLSRPFEHRSCQSCHAPLAEQQEYDSSGAPSSVFDPALREQGVLCAGCHVRAHVRSGPPRRPDAPRIPEPRPHGGFEARTEYTESRFCAECHQFFDDPGVNGKPLENTYAEWLASPQAADGVQCQGCHMPDRAHTWRGIHDAETVRNAVDVDLVPVELDGAPIRAALVVLNRGVGHAFPTYVTPRVFVAVYQEDGEGREIDGTRTEAVIARAVDLSAGIESFDTRVLPGESVKLDYSEQRAPRARSLVGRVTVDPDHHYRGVYAYLERTLSDDGALELIRQANLRISTTTYVLAEIRRPLPVAPSH